MGPRGAWESARNDGQAYRQQHRRRRHHGGEALLTRVHQLNSIFAIFRVSDHDNPLVLKGRCL